MDKSNIQFPYIHLVIQLECTKEGNLPENKTSMIRGVIGRIFKKNVCHDFQLSCRECKYINSCVYPAMFEAPEQSVNLLQRGRSVPHPYILTCNNKEKEYQEGDQLHFELLLLGGQAEIFTTYLYHTFDKLEHYDFGKGKVKFLVKSVRQHGVGQGIEIYNAESIRRPVLQQFTPQHKEFSKMIIQFKTPLRMLRKGKVLRNFSVEAFLWQCQHRLNNLCVLHGGNESGYVTKQELPIIPEDSVRILYETWVETIRYSTRQNQSIALNGLSVAVELDKTEELMEWLPILQFGETFHIGKATTFGLGEYEIWYK
ncbi:TPA: CRISPR system precrRNA processing endoribonuclease RAMP protein Cas6 [Bacillus paranthracis]